MIKLARLLKDLPDVNAGAIFYVPSQNHQQYLNPNEPYDNYTYVYFGEDGKVKSIWNHDRDSYSYHKDSMLSDWFEFYDYYDNSWKEYGHVKTLDLSGW